MEEDPTGVKALWDRGLLSGASQKACIHMIFFLDLLHRVFEFLLYSFPYDDL